MSWTIFQLIVFGIPVLSLAWWAWADRRMRHMGAGGVWRAGLAVVMILLMSGYVWVFAARGGVVSWPVPVALYALVMVWGLVFLPLLALPSMVVWACYSLGSGWRKWRRSCDGVGGELVGTNWTRREWLRSAVTGLPVMGTVGAAAYGLSSLSWLRVREITVALADLPEALDGLRIAHVSDTHVGKFTRGEALGGIVEATNRLRADLVLFTGDLIDNSIADLPAAIDMLRRMEAGAGMFMVEGNHDLFDDPLEFRSEVAASGLGFLRNESAVVRVRGVSVQILGIGWAHGDAGLARNVERVAALREPAAFPILLAHHPHAYDRARELGLPLTLAGHTHGGQLMATARHGAGPALFRYWSGLYGKDGRALVVSNGAGNWFPLRVNAPAEVIQVTLRRG